MGVRIELFGIARSRAGVAEVELEATTFGEALHDLARKVPALTETIIVDGALAPGWLVSLDGAEFLADLEARLPQDARLLLISSQAGG